MKKRVLVCCACLFWGCATEPDSGPYDYCAAGDYQNCDVIRDAGDWVKSEGCDNPVTMADIYLGRIGSEAMDAQGNILRGGKNLAAGAGTGNDGYIGEIDNRCHQQGMKDGTTLVSGSDLDFIQIDVTPGTALRVSAERAFNSATSPVLYLYGEGGSELMTARADDGGTAYIDLIAPSNPFYVSVEEWKNYNYNRKLVCEPTQLSGGHEYRYVLKVTDVQSSDISDKLGLLSYRYDQSDMKLGQSAKPIHFEHSGQNHYVYFDYDVSSTGGCDFLIRFKPYSAPNGAMPVVKQIRLAKDMSGNLIHRWDIADIYDYDEYAYRVKYDMGMQDASNENLYHYWFVIFDNDWKYDYNLEYEIWLDNCANFSGF